MLCELSAALGHSLFYLWLTINAIMLVTIFSSSAVVFYHLYWPTKITFDKWRYKSNPQYPSPEKVRDEMIQTIKGMLCASICPSIAIHLGATGGLNGICKAFCGLGDYSAGYHIGSMLLALVASDLYEFLYHRLGHVNFSFWQQHKHHHVFYNPSPFSVIADEWIDQFFRSAPLLVIPCIAPINIDLLFGMYGVFFYFYGIYLHSGHELESLSAHNPIINTSFQHYCHHAKSLMNRPYHCGFFIKAWDNIFNCVYPEDKCFCAECCRKNGERTMENYEKVVKPNYAELFQFKMWIEGFGKFLKPSAFAAH